MAQPRSAEPRGGARHNPLAAVPTRVWIALALLVLAVIFVFQNTRTTRIEVLFVSISAPLWAVLLASVAVGILIGILGHRRTK